MRTATIITRDDGNLLELHVFKDKETQFSRYAVKTWQRSYVARVLRRGKEVTGIYWEEDDIG